ncbi:MAG: hypothetical protein KatS3mg076_2798 [Candidatus Binatia bacterium]|nr:MAG: hypothetical protein KatS3mg076_2798 [Candidatus Binatia bacterium]
MNPGAKGFCPPSSTPCRHVLLAAGRPIGRPIYGLVRVAAVPVAFALVLASCASTRVPPLTQAGTQYGMEEDEQKLIRRSDELERELAEKGLVYDDPALLEYLDAVGQKLVPPAARGRIRFRFAVLRDPTINAFALAQGSVYVHTGLLARLENEAQLAMILGHEVAHTVERHQLEFLRSLRNKTVAAKVAEMVLLPAAVVFGGAGGGQLASDLLALSYAATVTGFGRENEEEADRQGLLAMARAGYDVREGVRVFELLTEMEDPGALEGFFYSSHPSNEARREYLRGLLRSGLVRAEAGRTNAEAYRRATEGVVVENIRLRLRRRHYDYARREAERALARDPTRATLHYYLGEAHRLLATDPEGAAKEAALRKRTTRVDRKIVESFRSKAPEEFEAALEAYRRALSLDPSLALAHRGIGMVAHARGERETASKALRAYLAGRPDAPDRRYVEKILRELGS